jgi:hypothetical protein
MSILCKFFGHSYKAHMSFAKLSELGIGVCKLKAEKLEISCKRCHACILTAHLNKDFISVMIRCSLIHRCVIPVWVWVLVKCRGNMIKKIYQNIEIIFTYIFKLLNIPMETQQMKQVKYGMSEPVYLEDMNNYLEKHAGYFMKSLSRDDNKS